MTNAYHYVKVNRGVDTEASYPYEEKDNTKCRFQRANVGGECVTHMEIQEGNEEALRQAVATGKFSVAIKVKNYFINCYHQFKFIISRTRSSWN